MTSPSKLIAASTAVITYGLKEKFGVSLWYSIPIYIVFFLAWNGYCMLIYERYFNPLSRLPGPKVRPSSSTVVTSGTLVLG